MHLRNPYSTSLDQMMAQVQMLRNANNLTNQSLYCQYFDGPWRHQLSSEWQINKAKLMEQSKKNTRDINAQAEWSPDAWWQPRALIGLQGPNQSYVQQIIKFGSKDAHKESSALHSYSYFH